MTTFDFSPLYGSAIGIDRFARLFQDAMADSSASSFPPYDIEKIGDAEYRIAMAVAGFREEDIEIVSHDGRLLIKGKAPEPEGVAYLHRGIGKRAFERVFQMADHVKVVGANLEDGLLRIDLKVEVPEEMKPRRIAIGKAA